MNPATQTKIAIATFFVLSASAFAVRVSLQREGLTKDAFYELKRSWQQQYDLVLAGDSRLARGVSPERMQRTLAETRIANLGFDANSLVYEPYLNYVEETLDPSSERRVIVLGVDPYELTPRSTTNNGFIEYSQRGAPGSSEQTSPASVVRDGLAPLQVRKLVVPGETVELFDERGFIATDRTPIDETARLPRYRTKFDDNRVSVTYAQVLLDAVARWRRQGVQVFGFSPPISQGLAELERELSGFDQTWFIEEFERRGGVWISGLGENYQTYDGEHLVSNSAAKLSDRLATRLEAHFSASP